MLLLINSYSGIVLSPAYSKVGGIMVQGVVHQTCTV